MSNFVIQGFVETDKGKEEFFLEISEPRKNDDDEDFFCVIQIPSHFDREKRVFGVDARHTMEVSKDFVRTLMRGQEVVDEKGRKIQF